MENGKGKTIHTYLHALHLLQITQPPDNQEAVIIQKRGLFINPSLLIYVRGITVGLHS